MLNVLGEVLWRMPGRFNLISLLGRRYSLRCVLFHHIADRPSAFTDGMSVTIRRKEFDDRIRFLAQHYTPIDLETFLHGAQGGKLPRRPVLVTFDDAYASVAEEAAPICRKYRVPALFFVNAAFLGNRDLSMDNFLAYVANTFGLAEINALAREFNGPQQPLLRSRKQVTSEFIPTLSTERLEAFKRQLAAAVGVDTGQLANAARLYLSLDQLRELASSGFEIGNHTFSHVHCRILAGQDFHTEIENNKSFLESVLGREVRAFSLPYGSVADFTPSLEQHLKNSGHKAAFFVESRTNTDATNLYHLNRVSVHSASDAALFEEIEVLPRLRAIRDSFLGSRKRGLDPALPCPR
jgi:peptidoglycan/xylan/chitin deacetylase (PgdA/CDA1 family)